MTALALHVPERRGIGRWALSGATIVAAHAVVIGGLVLWYTRTPPEQHIMPAIAITLAAPTSAPSNPDEQLPIGTKQDQIDEVLPEPPKIEQPIEPPVDKLMPPPPQPAEVALPKPVPEVKKPEKPVEPPRPKQDARAAAPSNAPSKQASVAASQAYAALVSGHLRQFINRQVASKYGAGHAVVTFVLSRQGQVLSSRIASSSGNAALDNEALAIVKRANPFPPFPVEKSVAQELVYVAGTLRSGAVVSSMIFSQAASRFSGLMLMHAMAR